MVSMKHKWCLVFDGRYQEVLLDNLEGMTNFKNFYNAISLHTGAKLKGGMGGGGGGECDTPPSTHTLIGPVKKIRSF